MAISVSQQLIDATLRHLRDGVTYAELGLDQHERERIERVKYLRFLVGENPDLDVFEKFKRIAAGRYHSAMEEWHVARKDKMLYDAVAHFKTDG